MQLPCTAYLGLTPLKTHDVADCTCKGSSRLQPRVRQMDESSRHAEVFNYLHSNTYPSDADKNTKRGIRQRAALFELKEGVLCLKGTKRQWISCPKQQQQILRACHDDSLGCFTCMQTVAEKCLVSYDYS